MVDAVGTAAGEQRRDTGAGSGCEYDDEHQEARGRGGDLGEAARRGGSRSRGGTGLLSRWSGHFQRDVGELGETEPSVGGSDWEPDGSVGGRSRYP